MVVRLTAWSDLFNQLAFGEGALFGLMIVAVLGVLAVSKSRASAVIFILISGLMCISVLDGAGNNIEILSGVGYALLVPFFLIMGVAKGKSGF